MVIGRAATWWWIGGLFLGTLAISAVLGGGDVAGIAGGALRMFVFSAVLPLTWWAIGGFHVAKARGPLVMWTVLLVLVGLMNFAALNVLF